MLILKNKKKREDFFLQFKLKEASASRRPNREHFVALRASEALKYLYLKYFYFNWLFLKLLKL